MAGIAFSGLILFSCAKEHLPEPSNIRFVQFDNANDPDRLQAVNQVIPLRSTKSGKIKASIDYVFTLEHTLASPVVSGNPVQASHINYAEDHIYVAYNTAGATLAGGWEIIDFTTPATPVEEFSQGLATAEYSSVSYYWDSNTSEVKVLLTGAEDTGLPANGAFLHMYTHGVGVTGPFYRALAGYCGTDVTEVGVVTGTDGKFYQFNPLDFNAPAVMVDVDDARSCAYDPVNSSYLVLSGQPGRLFSGMPHSPSGTLSVGGLSSANTKGMVRVSNNMAYLALGEGGMKSINLSSGATVASIPAPTVPAGATAAEWVTNGVAVNEDGLIFIANGAAGVYVAREDHLTRAVEVLGFLDLPGSVNFVEAHGEYLFAASGEVGLCIIHVNGLRMVLDPRDNQWYNTIPIDTLVWMTENLRYEVPTLSYIYNNDPSLLQTHGRLYRINALPNLCPTGWRVPTDEDFQSLEIFIGMHPMDASSSGVRGLGTDFALRLMSTDHWFTSNLHINDLGFNLYGSGTAMEVAGPPLTFSHLYSITRLWTSTADPGAPAANFIRVFEGNQPGIYRGSWYGENYMSVRCVRNR